MLKQKKLKNFEIKNLSTRSAWKDAVTRFKRHKLAMFSLAILVVIVILTFIVPSIAKYNYDYVDWNVSFPSAPDFTDGHFFGTDGNGRDILVRLFMGVKLSITIGILASLVSLFVGVLWGSVAGFVGGKTDVIMMRIVDILYAIPFMFQIILFVVVFGRNVSLIFVAIGAIGWLTMSRIVRGQTISIKNKEFIEAARSYSLPTYLIILKHIIPNLLGTVIIYLTLTIPNMILIESFISFLGLGVQEPQTSLGVLIAEGSKVIEDYTWMFVFPFLFLSIILFCFNFIGDGLRDAFDQKTK